MPFPGHSKLDGKKPIRTWFLLSFYQGVVFTFETVWWDRSRARQAVQGDQIFDTLVKHFIQVCHRDVALKRFVIPCPCHHSQTAVTRAALSIWWVENTVVLCCNIVNHWIVFSISFNSPHLENNLIIIPAYLQRSYNWKLKCSHLVWNCIRTQVDFIIMAC